MIGTHMRKALAAAIAVGMFACGLTSIANTLQTKAQAEEQTPSYTDAVITKTADGTGHGTPAQTFVNSKNGFYPADDSPTDGVVSSDDTVDYTMKLHFSAAGKRTVKVSFNLKNAPYLEQTSDDDFCTPGRLVTAKLESDGSCVYTVPAGAVETLTRTFHMRAKDTAGVAQPNQKVAVTVARTDGASDTYQTDSVTVVSAPAADLVIDNGGNPEDGDSSERRSSWNEEASAVTGYFTIRPDKLTYPGYTGTHGATNATPWSATVDVSRFPAGTVWTLDGQTLTAQDGKLTIANQTGAKDLHWSIPTSVLKGSGNSVKTYDIRLIPDKTVFSAGTGSSALLNMGTGGEPGWNSGKNSSTYNQDIGARAGYPYANNDWSRAIVQYVKSSHHPGEDDDTSTSTFRKSLQRPYTSGKTIFDSESLSFGKTQSKADILHIKDSDSSDDNVATGTQVRTVLTMYASEAKDVKEGFNPYIKDSWNPSEQHWDGGLTVMQGDDALDPSAYVFAWSSDGTQWHTGLPSESEAAIVRNVRVTLDQTKVKFGEGAADIQVGFNTRIIAEASDDNKRVSDRMTAQASASKIINGEDYVWVVQPGTPVASIDNTVTAATADGDSIDTDGVPSGAIVTYVMHPQVSNVQLSGTAMTPRIEIPVPDGLTQPACDDPNWTMTVENGKLVFTMKSDYIANDLTSSGTATLPTVTWKATVSNRAADTVNASATMSVDVKANGAVKETTVMSGTATASFTVKNSDGDSAVMHANQSKAEINDKLTWTFNLYSKGSNRGKAMRTVLRLPKNGDKSFQHETWSEYTRGYSDYHGTYTLEEPITINVDNSTDTTVKYAVATKSRADKWSDDPDDYVWKTWDELTEADKANVQAVLLTSQFDKSDSQAFASANGTITLTPSGNQAKDRYVMWLGHSYFDGTKSEHQPWPDVSEIVSSSISGTVWWDSNENTTIDDAEERIGGVKVSLYKADASGAKIGDPIGTVKTGTDGTYQFDGLHSGYYVTEVARTEGTTARDGGVQTQVKTYYNQTMDIIRTRSWPSMLKDQARDVSGRIALEADAQVNHVDFGYAKPDPKATLDKTQTKLDCPEGGSSCTISWDVKVTNPGSTTFPVSSTLTDRMNSEVKNVTATAGTVSKTGDSQMTFTQVEAGGNFSVALDGDGHLWAWGANGSGQLGDGKTSRETKPVKVSSDLVFKQFSAGSSHTLAVDKDGNLWAWGADTQGKLGDGGVVASRTPKEIILDKDTRIKQVSAGGNHSLALDKDGHLWAWGANGSGQLGNGGVTASVNTPNLIDAQHTYVQIAAGGNHSLALDTDGHLWAWGANGSGQLGNGNTDNTNKPAMIQPSQEFKEITAGNSYSLALDKDGHLWAWGANGSGQLGNGTTNEVANSAPEEITLDRTYTHIAAGYAHSLALDSDGHLWAWGANNSGQLGNGDTAKAPAPVDAPVEITPNRTYTHIAANGTVALHSHSLAVDSEGHLWAWGKNSAGQLGNGTTTNASTPTQVKASTVPGVSVDPTAVPVTPISESSDSDSTTRVYNLPYSISPNGYVVYHFTGEVRRGTVASDADSTAIAQARKTITNQAWFSSPSTPYSGTPHAVAANVSKPNKPEKSRLDSNSHDVKGNPTCMTGSDYATADLEHTFSNGNEDSCDQVGATIEPLPVPKTPIYGSISGLYWLDANGNGIRDDGETTRFAGQTVILYKNGTQIATTTTDANGTYKFDDLDMGSDISYTIRFGRVEHHDFTTADVNDSNVTADRSSTDSDATTDESDYGMATPTIILTESTPNKEHVDAGVLAERWVTAMPSTGLGQLLLLLLLVSIATLVAAIVLLTKRK